LEVYQGKLELIQARQGGDAWIYFQNGRFHQLTTYRGENTMGSLLLVGFLSSVMAICTYLRIKWGKEDDVNIEYTLWAKKYD
jgi:hypothetical protein